MRGLSGLLSLSLSLGSTVSFASADVLKNHLGNTSPATEGWTEYIGSNCSAGPLTDDVGQDAWFTNDAGASGGESVSYSFALTAADLDSLHSTGWKMSARVRVPAQSSPSHTVACWFADSATRFAINLWRDASQQTWVSLGDVAGGDWTQGPTRKPEAQERKQRSWVVPPSLAIQTRIGP